MPDGFVIVDKPAGMTSHDVVAQIRRTARVRRVGHGGTLDPMATGVLVVAVGRATRLLTYVTGTEKEYAATVRLGARTTTDDAEGEVLDTVPAAEVTGDAVRAALAGFTGEIDQVPSAVSAVKVAGRRAYQRVRDGEQVELESRRVTVRRLDVHELRRPTADLCDVDVELACSTGTYVRALARDVGEVLGVGGHLVALRRTRVGPFTLARSRPLAALTALPVATTAPAAHGETSAGTAAPGDTSGGDRLVTLSLAEAAGALFPRRQADEDETRTLRHGGAVRATGVDGPYAVFDPHQRVVAIVAEREGRARPQVVLAPADGGS